jgi:thioredoxin reductase (NADPH)
VRGRSVFVAGGGNSAGQAALHMAKWAAQVTILVRGQSLADSMSDYLIRQIRATPNINVHHHVQVADGTGTSTGHLQSLVLADIRSGARHSIPADALFVLIGSEPRTRWLGESIARDQWGFILTGPDLPAGTGHHQSPGRASLPLETSLPGVFAAGDVREGSVKRVAAAVGEGAATIPLVHRYLQTTTTTPPAPGRQPPDRAAHPRPEHRQRPGERAHAHRAQHDHHPASEEARNGAGYDKRLHAETAISAASGCGHRR